jgi:biotin carboxyl carrier protein
MSTSVDRCVTRWRGTWHDERMHVGERPTLYRGAALEAHRRGDGVGRPLAIVSLWTRLAVATCVLAVVSALSFAASVRLSEYAEGIALVRREGRMLVNSPVAGTVEHIAVSPGQHVRAGEMLVRFDDGAQRAELERAELGYELRLVELLREPSDSARHERLAAAEAERRLAQARVHARACVAPHAGVVADVRVRSGASVGVGDAVVSLEREGARTVVVGLFPGHVRPLLAADETRVLLELDGFSDRQELEIRSIADDVVGPNEALRSLGRDLQGAIELHGPVVMVEAELSSDSIESDGVTYRVYDGMQGRLEAKLRARTLLESLIPALERR